MLSEQVALKTERGTFSYRNHKGATPGTKEETCLLQKQMSRRKKTHVEEL